MNIHFPHFDDSSDDESHHGRCCCGKTTSPCNVNVDIVYRTDHEFAVTIDVIDYETGAEALANARPLTFSDAELNDNQATFFVWNKSNDVTDPYTVNDGYTESVSVEAVYPNGEDFQFPLTTTEEGYSFTVIDIQSQDNYRYLARITQTSDEDPTCTSTRYIAWVISNACVEKYKLGRNRADKTIENYATEITTVNANPDKTLVLQQLETSDSCVFYIQDLSEYCPGTETFVTWTFQTTVENQYINQVQQLYELLGEPIEVDQGTSITNTNSYTIDEAWFDSNSNGSFTGRRTSFFVRVIDTTQSNPPFLRLRVTASYSRNGEVFTTRHIYLETRTIASASILVPPNQPLKPSTSCVNKGLPSHPHILPTRRRQLCFHNGYTMAVPDDSQTILLSRKELNGAALNANYYRFNDDNRMEIYRIDNNNNLKPILQIPFWNEAGQTEGQIKFIGVNKSSANFSPQAGATLKLCALDGDDPDQTQSGQMDTTNNNWYFDGRDITWTFPIPATWASKLRYVKIEITPPTSNGGQNFVLLDNIETQAKLSLPRPTTFTNENVPQDKWITASKRLDSSGHLKDYYDADIFAQTNAIALITTAFSEAIDFQAQPWLDNEIFLFRVPNRGTLATENYMRSTYLVFEGTIKMRFRSSDPFVNYTALGTNNILKIPPYAYDLINTNMYFECQKSDKTDGKIRSIVTLRWD